jgi:acetylornithine deacetylase/succinyl-diaminopimelate desuccinylase-like protein
MKIKITLLAIAYVFTLCYSTAQELKADKKYQKVMTKLLKNKKVKKSIEIVDSEESTTIANMILLNEIPAPPFKEAKRAKKLMELFDEIGVDKVWIDSEGNVIALRKGSDSDKNIALDAHLDTVFPEGTDVTVKVEGNTYTAPGIGDDTRALAMIITVLKAMNDAEIKTKNNIYFIGTVGEEGLGDLRGVKHLFSDASDVKIDSWISIDGGSPGRIVNGGLGSRRYKTIFKGKGGHSWGAFGIANPHHALGKAIEIFTKKATEYTSKDGLKTSFNIGVIGGGTSVNSIPFESWMEVDMRSLSPERLIEIDAIFKESMKAAVSEYNESGIKDKVELVLEPIGNRPSGKADATSKLVQMAIASANYLGITPKLSTSSTNSNIPIAKNIPAITLSRGGKGSRAHSLDEKWTNIDGAKNIKLALLVTLAEAGLQ